MFDNNIKKIIYDTYYYLKNIIKNSNNELLYSVPYHPETNAIEEFLVS